MLARLPVMLVSQGLSGVFRNLLAVIVRVCVPDGNRDFIRVVACSTDIPRWMFSTSGNLDGSRPPAGGAGAELPCAGAVDADGAGVAAGWAEVGGV